MMMMLKMMQSSSSSSGSSIRMVRQVIQAVSLLTVVLFLVASQLPSQVECQEQLSIESRQQKDNDDLTDTIKYLEKLDKYFSQIARPRFGRSEYKQPHRLQPGWSLAGGRFGPQADPLGPAMNNQQQQNVGGFDSGADLLELARSRLY